MENMNNNDMADAIQNSLLEGTALELSIFFKIADAVPDMLYVTDIQQMRKIYSNKRIHDLFKMSQQQIAAMGPAFFDKIVHPEDKNKYFDSIEKLKFAEDNEINELKYRIIDHNKQVHWLVTKRKVFKRDAKGIPLQIIGISQDITEQIALSEEKNRLTEEKLKLKANQQREVIKAIISAQEEERQNIAEVLHNEIGQLLFAAQLKLPSTEKESRNIINTAIKKVRQISFELTPILLNDMGLEIALKDMLKRKLEPLNINFNFSFSIKNERLIQNMEIVIYRIIQELLNNSIKYAEASQINVLVLQKENQLYISQTDNGKGMDTKLLTETEKGFGLKNITNRLHILNGVFEIFSTPSKGTKVLMNIPLNGSTD